jgi:hypothetical protein
MSERETGEFDAEAVGRHLAEEKELASAASHPCPGSMVVELQGLGAQAANDEHGPQASALRNWPVQLRLAPLEAQCFDEADLLLAADCVPFALAGFHERLLRGKALIIGCPKLDDVEFYLEKLSSVLARNDIRSLTVTHMEVPCCFGLLELAREALERSGREIPVYRVKIGISGEVLEEELAKR